MKVEVRFFAGLEKYNPVDSKARSAFLNIEEGTILKELIARLNIPADFPKIILVNGRNVSMDEKLNDGDVISLFPPLAGGVIPPSKQLI